MSFTETRRKEIILYLLRKISVDDPSLIPDVADAFGISQTSVRRYLERETNEGHIRPFDEAACGYALCTVSNDFSYDLRSLYERDDDLAYEDALPFLPENPNAGVIWQYVLTEIFNNATSHSQGSKAGMYVESNHLFTRIWLEDDGIGIFANILSAMRASGVQNPKPADAVTELYKGKFTSLPENHSGEGIYFSMQLLDKIAIISDDLILRSGFSRESSYIRSHLLAYYTRWTGKGTIVMMQLENQTGRVAADVFSLFADVDEGFVKTRIPVLKACLDREPVSRSQARRICDRLEQFHEVILDFEDVTFLGQGFADEMFRVFQNEQPQLKLTPVNMAADVQKMYLYTIHNKVM